MGLGSEGLDLPPTAFWLDMVRRVSYWRLARRLSMYGEKVLVVQEERPNGLFEILPENPVAW